MQQPTKLRIILANSNIYYTKARKVLSNCLDLYQAATSDVQKRSQCMSAKSWSSSVHLKQPPKARNPIYTYVQIKRNKQRYRQETVLLCLAFFYVVIFNDIFCYMLLRLRVMQKFTYIEVK